MASKKARLAPLIFGSSFHDKNCIVMPRLRYNLMLFAVQRGLLTWDQSVALDTFLFRRVMGNDDEYVTRMRAIMYNLSQHEQLREEDMERLASMDDAEMRKNSVLERIEIEQRQRRERFEKMLQERYDDVKQEESLLSCRKCGSDNISWQQKQTRSADEAMTVFCTCKSCKHRWTMS